MKYSVRGIRFNKFWHAALYAMSRKSTHIPRQGLTIYRDVEGIPNVTSVATVHKYYVDVTRESWIDPEDIKTLQRVLKNCNKNEGTARMFRMLISGKVWCSLKREQ